MIRKLSNKLILLLVIVMTTVMIFSGYVNAISFGDLLSAPNIGKTIDIGWTWGGSTVLAGNEYLYCAQHQNGMFANATYKVENYVKIEKNKATSDSGRTKNDRTNLVLAYILGGGNYAKGHGPSAENMNTRQLALYMYLPTWGSAVGSSIGIPWTAYQNTGWLSNSQKEQAQKLINEAEHYADNNVIAQIKSKVGEEITTSNVIAGPFKVEYTGTISSVEVNDASGKITSGITLYKEKECKTKISAKDIKSNQNFYVKNSSGKTIKNVKVNVTGGEAITAEMWFLRTYETRYINGYLTKAQNLIAVKANKVSTFDSVTIKVKTLGTLVINKKDGDTKAALNNAGFKIKTSAGWLSGTSGNYKYDTEFSKATVYKVSNGKLTLNDLAFRTYGIYEVEAPTGYKLEYQKGYDSKNKWVKVGNYKVAQDNNIVTVNVNNTKYGKIIINKADAENSKTKLKAGFKIYSETTKGWVATSGNTYKYDNNEKNATVFYTDNGTKTIGNLEYGTYKVYETEAPSGYSLEAQEGYKDGKVLVGTATLNGNDGKREVTFNLTNIKLISISGYVWVDGKPLKGEEDGKYTSQLDKRLTGVKVSLINKSTGKAVKTVTTDSNGEYVFDKLVTKNTLKNYYVAFDYTGTDYKSYIPVAYNSKTASEIVANGSRAIVGEMATYDADFKGIATTYAGTNANNEKTYGLSSEGNIYSKLFNSKTNTLENINLGIRETKTPEYNLKENIEYVKINMKGYTYTYYYGKPGDQANVAAPQVRWQSGNTISAYTRAVYPSDIAYDKSSDKQQLQVYVGYSIDITNTTNYNIEEVYMEQKLHVTNLANKFDTARYTLHDSNWEANGDTATIKQEYLKDIRDTGIEKGKTATKYIEFSVNRPAIHSILQNPKGIIENFPTKVTSDAYHEYTRYDYSWKNNVRKVQTHYTSNDRKESEAPYMIFKIGEERVISGTVFEDISITNNGEKLGNGVHDDKENLAQGVKVELVDSKESTDLTQLTVTGLYPAKRNAEGEIIGVEVDENDIPVGKPAIVNTDKNGAYSLVGVVPGEYYLRFTYGDGTQKLYDISGNEVKQIKSSEYKSTIVTSAVAKNAIQNGASVEATKHTWYKKLEGTNYSVAVDNMASKRLAMANENTNTIAGTAEISITVENTESNEANVGDGMTEKAENRNYKGFNLGIIKQPEQNLKIEKIVTNMKLTNSQNNLIFNGNPATTAMQGVTDLTDPKNPQGSRYVRAEIVEDSIYGSTLEATYGIKVTNISDVNYYGEKYYWFGDKTGAYEVTVKVNEVVDYLDKNISYVPQNSDQNRIELTSEVEEATEGDTTVTRALLKITGWSTLYTENNKERTAKSANTSETVKLGVQKILSMKDDDMEIVNEAKITKAENDSEQGDRDRDVHVTMIPKVVPPEERARAVITITPPTGADKQSVVMYVAAGVIALAVLSTGIVLIKKRIIE